MSTFGTAAKQATASSFVTRSPLHRVAAADALNIDLPVTLPLAAEDWPIGAAMLQFPSVTADGRTVRAAGPAYWRTVFSTIRSEGFDMVEIPSAWLAIGDMPSGELDALKAALAESQLGICATSVVRQSIIDAAHAAENIAATHRAIDAAAAVGSPLVCLGLHEPLNQTQLDVTWFWTVPGATNPDDRAIWNLAVSRYQELADHAAQVGVLISLELYEGTYLGNCDSALAFLHDIGRDNVGLNPDMGNLVRAPEDIEPWESMAVKVLPHSNYWHVKNYVRLEDPASGTYLSSPAPMASGLINYRKAIAFAVAHGFRGAFLCENYGGDGLTVSAENRRYIQRLLKSIGGGG